MTQLLLDTHAGFGWEIATMVRIGKLPGIGDLLNDLPEVLIAQDFDLLPITLQQGLHAGGYPIPHRDPYRCAEDSRSCPAGLPLPASLVARSALGVAHASRRRLRRQRAKPVLA